MKKPSLLSFYACVLILLATAFSYPKWQQPATEATISWDVVGYYLYLPGLFIYQDLGRLDFLEGIMEKYRPATEDTSVIPHENGNRIIIYSCGQAISFSPFFGLAHAWALISERYPADGFSFPYQVGISFGSLLVAMLGLWLARCNLLEYFDERTTAWALLLLVAATNYLNYAAIDNALTHNYLFTWYALLIFVVIRWYRRPTWGWSLLGGLVMGLLATTRPSEMVCVFIPLLWGLKGWRERFSFWQAHWGKLLLTAVATVSVGCLQLIYWKYATGHWIHYSYEFGFSWWKPYLEEVLISYQKGWLVYTPFMVFAILGLVPLFKNHRSIFWAVLVFGLINFYIVSAWSIWWYGGSFGQRALVQSYALLIFPLAGWISWLRRRKLLFGLFLLLSGFCVWLNIFQTIQAHNGTLHPEFMTKAYYWKIFGKLHATDWDRLLLDTDTYYEGERQEVQVLARENFEAFPDSSRRVSVHAYQGHFSTFVSQQQKFSPELSVAADQMNPAGEWIRVSAYFYIERPEPNIWNYPQLTVFFQAKGQRIYSRQIRVNRVLQPGVWKQVWIDVPLPKESFERVGAYVWNAGSSVPLFIDQFTMEHFFIAK